MQGKLRTEYLHSTCPHQTGFFSGEALNLIFDQRLRFATALLPRLLGEQHPRSHHKGKQVGFKLATNSIQFYVIANLDKTSLTNRMQDLGNFVLIIYFCRASQI